MTKIAILSALMSTKLARELDMGDRVENLKSELSRLSSMSFEIKEPLKLTILLTSVSYLRVYTAIIVSINTQKEEDAISTYVTTLLVGKQKTVSKLGNDTRTAQQTNKGSMSGPGVEEQQGLFHGNIQKAEACDASVLVKKLLWPWNAGPIRKVNKTSSIEKLINLI